MTLRPVDIVALNIRQIRVMLGITQATLAEKAGITRAAMSQIEGGERIPSLASFVAIAEALGVSLDRLVEKRK